MSHAPRLTVPEKLRMQRFPVPTPEITGDRGVGKLWFSPAAFARPQNGTFGNAGINILQGPRTTSWDLAMFKNFKIYERAKAQLRLEAYNFSSHINLSDPNVNPTAGSWYHHFQVRQPSHAAAWLQADILSFRRTDRKATATGDTACGNR